MIVRSDALVLSSMEYGETSRIVRLFTRERGKLSVMAKGARRMKSKFGSTLEPLSYTQVVFYYRSTRSLQTLSESAHLEPFLRIRRDLERITLGLRMVELVQALVQEEDPQPRLFNVFLQSLRRLNAAPERPANILPFFQLRLAGELGFRPQISRDDVERLPSEGGALDLRSGSLLLRSEAPSEALTASRTALRAYAIFARASLDDVMRMEITPGIRGEVNGLVDEYLRFHTPDAYPDKSRDVIQRLFDSPGGESR